MKESHYYFYTLIFGECKIYSQFAWVLLYGYSVLCLIHVVWKLNRTSEFDLVAYQFYYFLSDIDSFASIRSITSCCVSLNLLIKVRNYCIIFFLMSPSSKPFCSNRVHFCDGNMVTPCVVMSHLHVWYAVMTGTSLLFLPPIVK